MKHTIYLILILLFTIVAGCSDIQDTANTKAQITDYPDQESWNAQMFFTREGRRRAILEAGYIAKYSKKKYTLLKEGVKVDFYDENGEHKSVLTSDEAKVFDDKDDMIATGNVVVVSDNGTRLYSEELIWENKTQKIRSEVPVKITTESDTLYGDTFLSDPDLVDYEITNAHGTSKQTIKIDE